MSQDKETSSKDKNPSPDDILKRMLKTPPPKKEKDKSKEKKPAK